MSKHDTWRKLTDQPGNIYTQSSAEERETMRGWLHGLLIEQPVTVIFSKADGAERIMKCTLKEDLGAKYNSAKDQPAERKKNDEVCVVWDMEQQAWRSFRYDRLKRIEFSLG